MKKSLLPFLFLAISFILFSLAQAKHHQVSLTIAKRPTFAGELVSYESAEKVALIFAQNLSGQLAVGPTIIYNGVDGKPAVYMFVFSLKEVTFPDESQILKKVALGWELYQWGFKEGNKERTLSGKQMITGEGDFLTVVVSARKERGPVVEYFHGLPLHYTAKEKAIKLAKEKLASDQVSLSQHIYASPFDLWFEFQSGDPQDPGDRKTYVSPLFFSTHTAEEVFVTYEIELTPTQREKIRSDWEMIEGGAIRFGRDEFRITGVPDFDFSYGCSPTAAADVLGYWDANGYPLLIDYYFNRWDPILHVWVYNVPNVQQELCCAMCIDSLYGGVTHYYNIGPGITNVCNSSYYGNMYEFSYHTDYTQSLGYLINEIRLGYPAIWHVFSHPTYGEQSLCAMGWGPPDTTYICVHDTWSSTPEERLLNWNGWEEGRRTIGIRTYGGSLVHDFDKIQAARASMIVTNYGAIADGDVCNPGFMWNETNQLWDGSLILAWVVPGDTMIAIDMFTNHVRDSWYPYEYLMVKDTSFGEFGATAFIDIISLGVEIEQYSVGFSNPEYGEFILQQYVIKNSSDTTVHFYVSLGLDWDVFDWQMNAAYGDSLHNLAWHWCPSQPANQKFKFGCIRLPTDDNPVIGYESVSHPFYIYPQEGWRDDQLWGLITKACWQDDSSGYDLSLLMTPGMITLPPDSAHLESFIIFGVDTTEHLICPTWWKSMLRFCGFYRGDVQQDGIPDVGDVVYLITYLFRGGDPPQPFPDQGDVNRDGVVDVGDVVFLISFLYLGGLDPKDVQRFLPEPWRSKFKRSNLILNPNWD